MALTNKQRTKLLIFESGEHIIGQVVTQPDDNIIVLENPQNLVPEPSTQKLMFYSGTQYSEGNEMTYFKSKLRCPPVEPKNDILNGYDATFGSGIVLASGDDNTFKM